MKKITILFTVLIAITIKTNAQWQQTSLNSELTVECLAVSGNNIFAGTTWDEEGIFLSTNNGASWTAVNTGLTGYALDVYALAISGNNIFAGTDDGVYLSSNNGNSWTATGITNTDVCALAISGSNIFAGTWDGVYLSSNNGSSWTAVNNGLTGVAARNVHALAVSGSNIFAGTGEGVYLSSNNGSSWSAINTGLPTNIVSVEAFAINGSNIFAGTFEYGAFLSSNNGSSWTAVNTGLNTGNGIYVYSFVTSGNNIFAGTGAGGSGGAGVYFSSNNGSNWIEVNTSLEDCVLALAISGGYIFAGTLQDGVWKLPLSQVGIEETDNNASNIAVYPNPAADRVFINIKEKQDMIVQIYNVVGECVLQRELNNGSNEIEISSLSKGIYVIQLTGADGTIQQKLIKE